MIYCEVVPSHLRAWYRATGGTPPPKKKCVRSSNLGGWNDACFLHWAPEKVCEYFRREGLLAIAEALEGELLLDLI